MNRVFQTSLDKFMIVFIDDIMIYSRSWEEHTKYLKTVLRTLAEHQLHAKFSKCEFWLDRVQFLAMLSQKMEYPKIQPKLKQWVSSLHQPTFQKFEAFLN